MIEANISGFKEIETLLLAISNKYEKPKQAIKHLKKPVRNALKVAQKKLKSSVSSHVDTGQLKRTIKITVRDANRKYRRKYPNAVIMAQVGFVWKKSEVPDDFYKRVLALEYGTRHHPPYRYVAKIMFRERRGMINSVIVEAKKEILSFAKTQSQINDAKSRR